MYIGQKENFIFHPVSMYRSVVLQNADLTYVSALLKTKSL